MLCAFLVPGRLQTAPTLPSSVAPCVDLLGDRCGALELQVQIKRLLRVELLAAVRALERPPGLDAHAGNGAVARLRCIRNLHFLGHPARRGGSQVLTGVTCAPKLPQAEGWSQNGRL